MKINNSNYISSNSFSFPSINFKKRIRHLSLSLFKRDHLANKKFEKKFKEKVRTVDLTENGSFSEKTNRIMQIVKSPEQREKSLQILDQYLKNVDLAINKRIEQYPEKNLEIIRNVRTTKTLWYNLREKLEENNLSSNAQHQQKIRFNSTPTIAVYSKDKGKMIDYIVKKPSYPKITLEPRNRLVDKLITYL